LYAIRQISSNLGRFIASLGVLDVSEYDVYASGRPRDRASELNALYAVYASGPLRDGANELNPLYTVCASGRLRNGANEPALQED